jgi:Na+/proline symporter
MLAGFAAAYMSTVGTMMNLSASYMINDVYSRFIRKNAPARHYVTASRVATVLVTLASAVVTCYMTSIAGAWRFLMTIGAGAGLVFILRGFWWRINAWSEISALSAAAVFSTVLQSRFAMPVISLLHRVDPALQLVPLDSSQPHGFAWLMLVTTLLTTITWPSVTFLTAPEPKEKLQAFYDRVHSDGNPSRRPRPCRRRHWERIFYTGCLVSRWSTRCSSERATCSSATFR